MKHVPRGRAALAIATVAAAMVLTTAPVPGVATTDDFVPQLVTVDTPDRATRDLLATLPLDLTEHAGHDYVEVVLHTLSDRELLDELGLGYDVRIPDLAAREAENRQQDAAYAEATAVSPLPSGRDAYRSPDDYAADMDLLVAENPELVRPLVIGQSVEGRDIRGLEIAADVAAPADGRPTFLMFGLHHAREWPSGEHTIEFAFDLVDGWNRGDTRIVDLLERSRVVLVPVSNPDGFAVSYTAGQLVDLREVDGGGTVSILGTPGNAYKRKNCRVVDGAGSTEGACDAFASPGGFGIGIDLNRNYGALWGGPGASDVHADPTYHGAAPFSEPETQAIRELISSRHVTTLISNHTFGNLLLRPNGVHPQTIAPDGFPVGFAPDEGAMAELGARMTAQNGYTNQHGWELYDTTGTTEDYSYNATGGFGYTFELGPNEFHPPFEEVVDEYLGAGEHAGKGNREAYLIALQNAVDTSTHSVLEGKAPAGAVLRLRRTASTPTWDPANDFTDTVETTMVVGEDGRFEWHVNPSTRPFVQSRQALLLADEPFQSQTFTGGAIAPLGSVEYTFELTRDADVLDIRLDWPTPDDLDLVIHDADGNEVASSTNFIPDKEHATVQGAAAGTYTISVVNYASVAPSHTVTVGAFDADLETLPRLYEAWTLTCEVDGEVRETVPVMVDRGEWARVKLQGCSGRGPRR